MSPFDNAQREDDIYDVPEFRFELLRLLYSTHHGAMPT
jgi:hypothetical protein